MVTLEDLTRRYPNGRGVFHLSLTLGTGEIFGYLGPNGSGKSTTIRLLMGFLRPDGGRAAVDGLDCWKDADKVQRLVGYLPDEIGFLDDMIGHEFLELLASMRKLPASQDRRPELLERFELDVKLPIRKMSKGTKQKLGLVAALMHQPPVLILDEPTSGLDPLMQERFLALMQEERKRGVTVLMSSHVFSEVERVCDRVGILRDGTLVAVEDMTRLRETRRQVFRVALGDSRDVQLLEGAGLPIIARRDHELDVEVHGDYNDFVRALSRCDVRMLTVHPLTLEEIFLHHYGTEEGPGA